MPVVIFFPKALLLFQILFWNEGGGITYESLQIMILVMDLIKVDDSSISRSFAGHGKM